ncbi:unnamed protein product [Adineta steineri]|uniref:Uncharacterized protein n=1 Tax=Adineta steineri TaxID=433720 RepID=A0A815TSJ8_9BILA|nr:unnamed protein product [Adineta steineri]CAF1507979.1 unnamed protein product [Adineta steineri]
MDDSSANLEISSEPIQQQLSKNQKRRLSKQRQRVESATIAPTVVESNISAKSKISPETTETLTILAASNVLSASTTLSLTSATAIERAAATLNFDRLTTKPRSSVTVVEGQRMASNDEYFLVCPEGELCLLDTQGNKHRSLKRTFNVSDICWSAYLKQFLILSDEHLYSFDMTRETALMIEISQFARYMDECTCYDNIFMVVSDFGGSIIEMWDMTKNWQSIKRYKPPISRKEGQGICSIRFSSSGAHLGVTLTEPRIVKAYFQIRNWQDMIVLHTVEQPFYEGYCNHYMLALPNDEFLVYKYSQKKLSFFHSNGQQKQTIQYAKGVCSVSLVPNDKNCLAIQTSRPDQLHFYDL